MAQSDKRTQLGSVFGSISRVALDSSYGDDVVAGAIALGLDSANEFMDEYEGAQEDVGGDPELSEEVAQGPLPGDDNVRPRVGRKLQVR